MSGCASTFLLLSLSLQFEALMVRLLTEEASQHKRNSEDEILAAFQALDTDKKGYLEQVLLLFSGFVSPSTHLLVIVSFPTLLC